MTPLFLVGNVFQETISILEETRSSSMRRVFHMTCGIMQQTFRFTNRNLKRWN